MNSRSRRLIESFFAKNSKTECVKKELNNVKKERRKKNVIYIAILGYMMIFLMACGALSARDPYASSTSTSENEETDIESMEKMQEGSEYLYSMMKLSVVKPEQSEESSISLSQMLTNIIVENTIIETLEESEKHFVVKIIYPDAGALMMEKMNQYEGVDVEMHIDEIFNEVINAVRRGECMAETKLTVEYVIDEFGNQTVVMTPALANAMSGGFYSYVENEQ